jgi:hypothetical protein
LGVYNLGSPQSITRVVCQGDTQRKDERTEWNHDLCYRHCCASSPSLRPLCWVMEVRRGSWITHPHLGGRKGHWLVRILPPGFVKRDGPAAPHGHHPYCHPIQVSLTVISSICSVERVLPIGTRNRTLGRWARAHRCSPPLRTCAPPPGCGVRKKRRGALIL